MQVGITVGWSLTPSPAPNTRSLDFRQQLARLPHQVTHLSALGNRVAGIKSVLQCVLVATRSS